MIACRRQARMLLHADSVSISDLGVHPSFSLRHVAEKIGSYLKVLETLRRSSIQWSARKPPMCLTEAAVPDLGDSRMRGQGFVRGHLASCDGRV
jgi:hypothetical protein